MAIVLISLALMICIGLLACLKGERLTTLFLTLYAFLITFQFVSEQTTQDSTGMIISLVAALAVALLAQYAQKVAFFILGFLIGAVLGRYALPYLPSVTGYMTYAVIAGCAIVGGIIFAYWRKTMVRIGTAYIGAEIISRCIVFLVTEYQVLALYSQSDVVATFISMVKTLTNGVMQSKPLWVLVLTIVITIAGTIYQNKHH